MRAYLPAFSNISMFLWSPGWNEYSDTGLAIENGKALPGPHVLSDSLQYPGFQFIFFPCFCLLCPCIFIQQNPFNNEMMQGLLHGQRSCSAPLFPIYTKCKQCQIVFWILLKRLSAEHIWKRWLEPQLF